MMRFKKFKSRKVHRDHRWKSSHNYSRKHQADTSHAPILVNSDLSAPAIINRIDDIIMFTPLGMDAIKKIVEIQLATQQKKFSENKIDVRFDDSVLSFIAHKAYSPEYGARPVRRAIKENIVDALCMSILRQEVNKEQPIVVRVDDNQILISNQ